MDSCRVIVAVLAGPAFCASSMAEDEPFITVA